jgi:phage-related protein
MEFDVDDYECRNGRRYAREFIEDLEKINSNLCSAAIALTKKIKFKIYHKFPYSEALGDGLFSIRVKVKSDIARIFYCFGKGQRIYLLRGFVKKDEKIPKEEMDKAKNLLEEFRKKEKKDEKN